MQIGLMLAAIMVVGQFDTYDAIQENIKATKAYRDDGDHWTQHISCIRPGSIRCYSRPVWYVGGDGERYRIDKDVSLDGADWQCATNSLQFRLTASGETWYRTGQYGVRLSLRESASIAGGSQVETVSAAIPTIAKAGHGLLSVTGALPDVTIAYTVLPGVVKEAVVLEKKPKNLTGDSYVIIWDWVAEGLTPIADGDEIDWATAESVTPMRFAPPHAVDVDGAVIPSAIAIDKQTIILSIPADALKDAKYPIVIDPTATTGDSDHDNGVSIGYDDAGDVNWYKAMGRIALPDLTGFVSITSASLYLYGTNSASIVFDIFFDDIGAWASSDSVSTLNALTWNASTDDDGTLGIQLGWVAYDILGSVGVNGIAEIYNNDPSGGTGSYLIDTGETTPAPDTKDTTTYLELGDEAGGPSGSGNWSISAGYEPYVEIIYTTGGGATNIGKVGIGSSGPIMGY